MFHMLRHFCTVISLLPISTTHILFSVKLGDSINAMFRFHAKR